MISRVFYAAFIVPLVLLTLLELNIVLVKFVSKAVQYTGYVVCIGLTAFLLAVRNDR